MTNSDNLIHTRQSDNLELPLANLTIYLEGVQYSGIKILTN